MATEALREAQEGIALANGERAVGEEEEDSGQNAAVGEPAWPEATGEIDSKHRDSADLYCSAIRLSQSTWQLKHLQWSTLYISYHHKQNRILWETL